nr:immunoglobulin heavy chain junction region [Mus musculus]
TVLEWRRVTTVVPTWTGLLT